MSDDRMPSFVEENYLKAIYRLCQTHQAAVSTNAIAEAMETKPASVTDMIRKLSDKAYINYRKYRGVRLTQQGEKTALQVIRKHRLWEVFLVDKLQFKWDEVHEIAEQLEHIQSPKLTQKLDKYLGYPSIDPHGDPIPNEQGEMKQSQKRCLAQVATGKCVVVVGVENSEAAFLAHLDKLNIALGTKVTVREMNEFDGAMQIALAGRQNLFISKEVAHNLLVTE